MVVTALYLVSTAGAYINGQVLILDSGYFTLNPPSYSIEDSVSMASQSGMINPSIFQYLQERIDEETAIKDV